MFFALSKILSFIIKPLFWIIIILISSIIYKKQRRSLIILSISCIMFFGNEFIVDEFYRLWQEESINILEINKKYNVGIVLGGFSSYSRDIKRMEFNDQGDRLIYAIHLYNLKKIKKIMISGGNGNLINDGNKEADWTKEFLINHGIKETDIIIENLSRNTIENAKYSKETLKLEKNILIITSSWHAKRALFCFNNYFNNIDVLTTDYKQKKRKYTISYIIMPSPDALKKWNILIKEWIGFIVYRIVY